MHKAVASVLKMISRITLPKSSVFLAAGVALAIVAAGCATVDPSANWAVVEQNVKDRLDKSLFWEKTPQDQEHITERIDALLADGMSRFDAMQIILLNNRQLQAMFEDIGMATADYVQASLPTNLNFVGGYYFPQYQAPYEIDDAIYGFISDIWLVPARKRVMELACEATICSVSEAAVQTAFEGQVSFDYVLYRRAEEQIQKELLKVVEQIEKRTKVLYASGLLTDGAVYQAEIATARRRSAVVLAERSALQAKAYLDRLLCFDPTRENTYVITGTLYNPVVKDWTYEAAFEYAYKHRLDVQRAEVRIAEAKKAIEYQDAAVWDTVQVGVSQADVVDNGKQLGPAVAITLPVFDQNQGRIARACYLYRKAVKTYQQLRARVRSEITDLIAEIKFRKSQIEQFETVILPKEMLDIAHSREDAQSLVSDWMKMLRAQEKHLISKSQYLQAIWCLRQANAQLHYVMIGGTVASTFGEPTGLPESGRAPILLPQLAQPIP